MPPTKEIEELAVHPKNEAFYGEITDVTSIRRNIEDNDFDEQQAIEIVPESRDEWPANRIVSGHRRRKAAKQAGLETVPIQTVSFDSKEEELNYLIRKNNYRQKTDAMLINEGRWYEEQIRSGEIDVDGRVTEAVGERIGMSSRSYEKGRDVAKAADDGDEDAIEQWAKLENGEQSIHGAYTTLNADPDENAGNSSRDDDDDDDMRNFSHDSQTNADYVVMASIPESYRPQIKAAVEEGQCDNESEFVSGVLLEHIDDYL